MLDQNLRVWRSSSLVLRTHPPCAAHFGLRRVRRTSLHAVPLVPGSPVGPVLPAGSVSIPSTGLPFLSLLRVSKARLAPGVNVTQWLDQSLPNLTGATPEFGTAPSAQPIRGTFCPGNFSWIRYTKLSRSCRRSLFQTTQVVRDHRMWGCRCGKAAERTNGTKWNSQSDYD